MASASNKNSPGDYKMEQARFRNKLDYLTDKTNGYGVPVQTHFAGNGLIMGRIASENLAHNACDIESYLRGTGATNLVNPMGKVEPEIKPYQSLSIIDRLPVIMPEPLVVQKGQRPYMN